MIIKSINFEVRYIDNFSNEYVLPDAIVENIDFRSNGINTVSFSIIDGLDIEATLPPENAIITIYAIGRRFGGNNFNDTILNKDLSDYMEYISQNQFENYELLIFIGEIVRINSNIEFNNKSNNLYIKHIFHCEGIERRLEEINYNQYYFWNTYENIPQIVIGNPDWTGNTLFINPNNPDEVYFTANGEGIKWNKFYAIKYLSANLTNINPNIIVNFEFSTNTIEDLQRLPVKQNLSNNAFSILRNICSNLFNFSFTYKKIVNETGTIYKLNIFIISKASISNYDKNFMIDFELTKYNFNYRRVYTGIKLNFPMYITVNGFFPIFRHPDNYLNEDYYSLTEEEWLKAVDLTNIRVVFDISTYFENEWTETFLLVEQSLPPESPFRCIIPIPEKYDHFISNSLGAKMGVHKKFIIYPIVNIPINNEYINVNLEEFYCLKLNDFKRCRFENNEYVVEDWYSLKPFPNINIKIDGNIVWLNADIPHIFAPSDRYYHYSTIKHPVFPINDGDFIYINGEFKSKKNIDYVIVGNTNDLLYIENDKITTKEQALEIADYLYRFYLGGIASADISIACMLEYYVDLLFLFGRKLEKILFSNQEVFGNFEPEYFINVVVNGFSIYRNDTYYSAVINLENEFIEADYLLEHILLDTKEDINNEIVIEGNISQVFYGEIIDITPNFYIVKPYWTDNPEETIKVAKIDDLKMGYWLNKQVADNIYFEQIDEKGTKRKMKIIKSDNTEEIRYNVVVPSETIFKTISFKVNSGNIKVYHCKYELNDLRFIEPPEFLVYSDSNEMGRYWGETYEPIQ